MQNDDVAMAWHEFAHKVAKLLVGWIIIMLATNIIDVMVKQAVGSDVGANVLTLISQITMCGLLGAILFYLVGTARRVIRIMNEAENNPMVSDFSLKDRTETSTTSSVHASINSVVSDKSVESHGKFAHNEAVDKQLKTDWHRLYEEDGDKLIG